MDFSELALVFFGSILVVFGGWGVLTKAKWDRLDREEDERLLAAERAARHAAE